MRRPPEVIEGPTLVLRRVAAPYARALADAVAESLSELRLFMDWAQGDPTSAEDYADFLVASDHEWDDDRAYGFHVFDRSTDALIGGCGLMRRRGPGAIEIGYWIHSDHTGRGLATEAAAMLVEAAWALPDVCRIVIRHDSANVASGRVAEKLGFHEVDRVAVEITAEGESGIDVIRERFRPEQP
ncbi:MAG: GNAT family N-acetyltransferase [Actinomycetota bacterium]